MPLGDSITKGVSGSSDSTGYRRTLYLSLTGAGHSVNFVGSQANGHPTDFDRDHEGHGGYRADQIRDSISSWLTTNPADIILLHIGTNDISQGQSVSSTVSEVNQILDRIDAKSTSIVVFLARIINRNDSYSATTTTYNIQLQALANTRIANGDLITVVDMEAALNYPSDLADVVHPNDAGYAKMAQCWFTSLSDYLASVAIQLSSFTGKIGNQDEIRLAWVTQTEINNYGFDIERRTSDSLLDHWSKIGFLPGFGTCNSIHHYYFIDQNLLPGKYNYRIKQINNDGSFEYYGIVEAVIIMPTTFVLEQNYPNPFNSLTTISFTLPSKLNVSLKIFDFLGRDMTTIISEELPAGIHSQQWNAEGLTSGIYFYKLQAGRFIQTKKLVLLK